MDSKTFVPLANALPCLEEVLVSMLPLAPTLGHYCPAPANAARLTDAHGETPCRTCLCGSGVPLPLHAFSERTNIGIS